MTKIKKTSLPLFLDKTLSGGIARQLSVFVLLIALALFFFWCFCLVFHIPLTRLDSGNSQGDFWNLIYFFSDSGSQVQAVEKNRFFVYLVSFAGSILLSGVLISTLSNIFQRRVENVEKGLVRYRLSDHLIIIGYNQSVPGLIMRLRKEDAYNDCSIVLLTTLNVAEVRMHLNSNLPDELKNNVLVYYGQRNSDDEILKIYPRQAKEMFILSENEEEDSDSLNMECLRLVAKTCRGNARGKLKCNVVFKENSTVSAFQRANLAKEIKEAIDLYPVVHHEILVNAVLVENQTSDGAIKYPPLDRINITENSDLFVHLVVIGMSNIGMAMGMQAAQIAHFPNFARRKTRITFIDKDAKSKMQLLYAQYSCLFEVADSYFSDTCEKIAFVKNEKNEKYAYLGDFTDTEFYFLQGSADTFAVRETLEEFAAAKNAVLTLAVCDENVHKAISNGIFLPRILYEKQIPVFIYQKHSASILQSLGNTESFIDKNNFNPYAHLYPFGMLRNGIHFKNRSLLWAQRVNYVYSYYVQHDKIPDSLPTPQEWQEQWIPAWNLLPVAKQWSNLYNANSIRTKLRSIGFTLDDTVSIPVEITENQVKMLARVEHNRWVTEELMIGYRPPTKEEREEIALSPILKKQFRNRFIHADLCAYDDLLVDSKGEKVQKYDEILIRSIPLIIE